MRAEVGSWLVVASHTDDRQLLHAEILAVGPDGQPPYRVRWLEDDHESLIFPGPDAQVLTCEEQLAVSTLRAAHAVNAQAAMRAAVRADATD